MISNKHSNNYQHNTFFRLIIKTNLKLLEIPNLKKPLVGIMHESVVVQEDLVHDPDGLRRRVLQLHEAACRTILILDSV